MAAFDWVTLDTVAGLDSALFLKPDYMKKILKISPSKALLLRFSQQAMGGASIRAKANAFRQLVQYPMQREVTITGFASGSTTSTSFQETGAYTRYVGSAVFKIPSTGEIFRLTSTPTSNSLTGIQRGLGGLAGPVASGTKCIYLANVAEEFGPLCDPVNTYPGYRTYFVGHMHTALAMSDLSNANQTWGPDKESVRIRADKAEEFAESMNEILMWGNPSQSSVAQTSPYVDTAQLYTPGGIDFYASRRNDMAAGDVLTYDTIVEFAMSLMKVGEPTEKMFHTDSVTMAGIAKIAKNMGIARQPASEKKLALGVDTLAIPVYGRDVTFVYDASVDRQCRALGYSMVLGLDYSQISPVGLEGVQGGTIERGPDVLNRYGSQLVIHDYKGLSPGLEEAHGKMWGYTVVDEEAA